MGKYIDNNNNITNEYYCFCIFKVHLIFEVFYAAE